MPRVDVPSTAVAFAVALLATPLVRFAALRLGFLDRPSERSSHQVVTPRAGGVAILAGLGAALAVAPSNWVGRTDLLALLAGALLVAAIGLLDDRIALPPWPRLLCHAAAAALLVSRTGGLDRLPLPPPLDVPTGALAGPLGILWIVTVVNFYNFMDGIDGLATEQALITASGLTLALAGLDPPAAALAAALAGASAGFLPANWPRASIFLGDVGSGVLGFTLAALPLLAPGGRRAPAVLLAAASLFLFLADAASCLLRRVVAGQRFYEPHREHLYQRWAARVGHGPVTLGHGVGALALTLLALGGWLTGTPIWSWAALVLGLGLFATERTIVGRLECRAGTHRGRPST